MITGQAPVAWASVQECPLLGCWFSPGRERFGLRGRRSAFALRVVGHAGVAWAAGLERQLIHWRVEVVP
jgi:hypothetical protein